MSENQIGCLNAIIELIPKQLLKKQRTKNKKLHKLMDMVLVVSNHGKERMRRNWQSGIDCSAKTRWEKRATFFFFFPFLKYGKE